MAGALVERKNCWRAALLAGIAVMTLAGCGAGDGAQGTPDGGAASAPAGPAATPPGHALRIGDLEYALTGLSRRHQVGSDFTPETASNGGVLVVVRYAMRNASDRPVAAYRFAKVQLMDPAGVVYNPDAGKTLAYAGEVHLDQKAFSDLNPGISTRGAEVFEVAADRFDPETWVALIGGKSHPFALVEPKVEAPPQSEASPASSEPVAAGPASPPSIVKPAAPTLAAPHVEAKAAARTPSPAAPHVAPRPAAPRFDAASAVIDDPVFAKRSRRLDVLVENAAVRDPTGAVRRDFATAKARRDACPDRACLTRWFAGQESTLSQWEGAAEILAEP